jgi:HflK protein
MSWSGVMLLTAGFGTAYLLSGIYQVTEGESGIIERFGKYVRRDDPGLHYHLPVPFEYVRRVNTSVVQRFDIGVRLDAESRQMPSGFGNEDGTELLPSATSPEAAIPPSQTSSNKQAANDPSIDPVSHFLHEAPDVESSNAAEKKASPSAVEGRFRFTGDQALLSASIVVAYRIVDPVSYLYHSNNVDALLQAVCESVLTTAFARTQLDDLLGARRAAIVQQMQIDMNAKLEFLDIGVEIQHLAYLRLGPPDDVVPAFRMASSAKEDRERYINEAETYAHRIITGGRAESEEIFQEARADATWMLARVRAEVAGIENLFAVAGAHSDATRQTLYLDTLEHVFQTNPQVFFSGAETPVLLDIRQRKEQP